jgi:aryl-alcohol dehydrogenase-like predicted oxidoreductase
MEYRPLGETESKVSAVCLGTMTWGEQNTEAEAHAQMDMAVEYGVNFFDTAELYPVPPKKETQGLTEHYIGTWFEKRRNRGDILLATKVVGPSRVFGPGFEYFRGEEARLSRVHIRHAVEGSLKRLRTDYIDLYQLHWPERTTNFFGKLGYEHQADEDAIPLKETFETLQELVKEGKIRFIGLSNETPWGMMESLRLARECGLPRIVSVQNPYNLLNRTYEVGLAEMSIREKVGLLAYSPLAFGALSGKYLGGAMPAGARMTLFTRFQRYNNPQAVAATERYVRLAKQHGLSPVQMALQYVTTRPFVTSNIIGATSLHQLKEDLESLHVRLSEDVRAGIEAIHTMIPNPSP